MAEQFNISNKNNSYFVLLITFIFLLAASALINDPILSLTDLNQSTEQQLKKNSYPHNPGINLQPNYNSNNTIQRIDYSIEAEIQSDLKDIICHSQIILKNIGPETLSFLLIELELTTLLIDSRISTIFVSNTINNLDFQWFPENGYNLLNITLLSPLEPQTIRTIVIDFILEDAIIQSMVKEDSYILLWDFVNDDDCNDFSLTLILPMDYTLFNESSLPPLEPESDYISPDGREMRWEYTNLTIGTELSWTVRFQKISYQTPTSTSETRILWWGMLLTFIGGLLIGGLIVFFIFKAQKDSQNAELLQSLLSEPEKRIIQIILENENNTTQRKIWITSGFSKSKVSYYISKLEEKGIIKKEPWGRMNKIKLIDKSFSQIIDETKIESDEENEEREE